MANGLDTTKTAARPSHEAIESTGSTAEGESVDQSAMESAKRAQNRIHDNETKNPGNSIFTK